MKAGDLELRPATMDDAAFVADVDTAVRPDDAVDPKMLRHWWTLTDADCVVGRWIAVLGRRSVGYARWDHTEWTRMPDRFMRIAGELLPGARTPERLAAVYDALERMARDEAARRVTSWAWEDDALRTALFARRGYREERRERFWELDLVANRERIERMAAESRERMKREGITLLTLDRDGDPKKMEKLKRMSDEAEDDVPTTVPHVAMPFDQWVRWFDTPGIHRDRVWIAREGDDVVGISQLAYPPVRGFVATDWTGTGRKVRGRGVARALKCETLMQAMSLGVDRVRTDNDSSNAPILHINETMGYRLRGEMIQFLKEI